MDYVTFDKLCKANGTSATALALKLGLSKGNTTSWRKGGNPSADILIKIADELNCTVDVLLGRGTYNPIYSDEDEKALFSAFIQLSDKDKAKVIERAETLAELSAERAAKERAAEQSKEEVQIDKPAADERSTHDDPENDQSEPTEILSETQVFSGEEPRKLVLQLFDLPVSAGTGVILSDNRYEPIEVYWSPEAERANYVLRVSGNSMEDDFHEGDLVLVESVKDISVGEIGIFVADGEGYIKVKGENALISLNSSYKPKPYSKFSTIQCIGRVLGKAKIV